MIWLNIHTFPIQWEPENFGIWRRLVDSSFKSPMNEKHKFNKLIVKLFAFVTASNTQYCFPCPQFSGFPCTLYSVLYCTVYCTVYIMVLYIIFNHLCLENVFIQGFLCNREYSAYHGFNLKHCFVFNIGFPWFSKHSLVCDIFNPWYKICVKCNGWLS